MLEMLMLLLTSHGFTSRLVKTLALLYPYSYTLVYIKDKDVL